MGNGLTRLGKPRGHYYKTLQAFLSGGAPRRRIDYQAPEADAGRDKHGRYRVRLVQAGRCPHCGKPCAPYYECAERRAYKRGLRNRVDLQGKPIPPEEIWRQSAGRARAIRMADLVSLLAERGLSGGRIALLLGIGPDKVYRYRRLRAPSL